MHDQHEGYEELTARMVALESQLQILTSGVSLTAEDDTSLSNSEIFRDFTGATSRFQGKSLKATILSSFFFFSFSVDNYFFKNSLPSTYCHRLRINIQDKTITKTQFYLSTA